MFILDRELQSHKCLDLKFGLQVQNFSDFFGKIPVRILLDVLLCVQVFLSVFLCPDIFIHGIIKHRRHLDTETYGRVAMAIFVISRVKLQINAEISRQN